MRNVSLQVAEFRCNNHRPSCLSEQMTSQSLERAIHYLVGECFCIRTMCRLVLGSGLAQANKLSFLLRSVIWY